MRNVQTTLPIGTIIRRQYVVEGLLRKDSFSALYLVKDLTDTQAIFALKEVSGQSKQERERFLLENESLLRLDHPALPKVYRVFSGTQRSRSYMLMEYIAGPNLEIVQQRQPQRRFALSQAMTIMAPIIDAVIYLHTQNPAIIHGSIKPSNIILPNGNDEAVLVDFGTAKEVRPTATTPPIEQHAPGYIAPEQYSGETNIRSDVYALGAIFYTLLTGIVPIDALYRSKQIAQGEPDPLVPMNQIVSTIPVAIAEVIQRAMSIDSDDRFVTIEELWQALNDCLINRQVSMPEVIRTVPAEQQHIARSRKGNFLLPILLALLMGMIVGATLLTNVVNIHSPVLANSKPGMLHKVTPASNPHSTVIAIPTSKPIVSPDIGELYEGKIYNLPASITTAMFLKGVQLSQGNIRGYFTGLHVSGTFEGNIDTNRNIQFAVMDTAGERILSFNGAMQSDGNLAGSYCTLDKNAQCTAEYGIWSVAPTR